MTSVNARGNNLKSVTAESRSACSHASPACPVCKLMLLGRYAYKAIARKLNGASRPLTTASTSSISTRRSTSTSRRSAVRRARTRRRIRAFTPIREWCARLPEAKTRGYEPGRFFYVRGGRCEQARATG